MNNAKKQRETIEWESLESSSRKLEVSRELHAKMGIIKDRNSKDLTETEEIKKRQQEHTEELYIKGLNDLDINDQVLMTWCYQSPRARYPGV